MDGGSGSKYEPNDEEEADDADEFSEEEEQGPTLHMSKKKTAVGRKGSDTQPEDEHPVFGIKIMAEVLKEHNTTFLSTMG